MGRMFSVWLFFHINFVSKWQQWSHKNCQNIFRNAFQLFIGEKKKEARLERRAGREKAENFFVVISSPTQHPPTTFPSSLLFRCIRCFWVYDVFL
jgi:hypothetical protein